MTLPFTVSALLYKFIISNGSYRSICSSVRDYLWVMSSGMELVCYLSWLVHFTQCLFVATAQERQQASKWDLYPEYCQSLPRCLPSIVFQQWKHPRFTEFFFYTNNLLLPTWMFVRDFFFLYPLKFRSLPQDAPKYRLRFINAAASQWDSSFCRLDAFFSVAKFSTVTTWIIDFFFLPFVLISCSFICYVSSL